MPFKPTARKPKQAVFFSGPYRCLWLQKVEFQWNVKSYTCLPKSKVVPSILFDTWTGDEPHFSKIQRRGTYFFEAPISTSAKLQIPQVQQKRPCCIYLAVLGAAGSKELLMCTSDQIVAVQGTTSERCCASERSANHARASRRRWGHWSALRGRLWAQRYLSRPSLHAVFPSLFFEPTSIKLGHEPLSFPFLRDDLYSLITDPGCRTELQIHHRNGPASRQNPAGTGPRGGFDRPLRAGPTESRV